MSSRRRRISVSLLCVLTTIASITSSVARAQGRAQDVAGATVDRRAIQLDLAVFDAAPLRANGALLTGFYAFRIVLDDRMDESVAIVADTVMRVAGLRELARSSRLYRCADPGTLSVLSCTAPLAGTIEANPTTLRVSITDTALVARVNRVRPAYFVLYAMQPGGRFQSYTIPFLYLD